MGMRWLSVAGLRRGSIGVVVGLAVWFGEARRCARWLGVAALLLVGTAWAVPLQGELQAARLKPVHTFAPEEGQAVNDRLVLGADGRLLGLSGVTPDTDGTFFRMTEHGHLVVLRSFDRAEGFYDPHRLVLSPDGNFHGVARQWPDGAFVLIRLTPHGKLTVVYQSLADGSDCLRRDDSALVPASDGDIYVVTQYGIGTRDGCIVRISPHGHASMVHMFHGDDGSLPVAMVESGDGYFYGITLLGGVNNAGTFFRMRRNGDVQVLYHFRREEGGWAPRALVEGRDGNFYGIAGDGTWGAGTAFRLGRHGEFTLLHAFEPKTDGNEPQTLELGHDGLLYGTTDKGGQHRGGTAFALSLDGALTVLHAFSHREREWTGYCPMTEVADGSFFFVSRADHRLPTTAFRLRVAPRGP